MSIFPPDQVASLLKHAGVLCGRRRLRLFDAGVCGRAGFRWLCLLFRFCRDDHRSGAQHLLHRHSDDKRFFRVLICRYRKGGNQHIGVGALAGDQVERDGVVTVEEAQTTEIGYEYVEGMEFDKGYVSPYMITDTEKMKADMNSPYVLITDKKISSIQEILPLLEKIAATPKRKLNNRRPAEIAAAGDADAEGIVGAEDFSGRLGAGDGDRAVVCKVAADDRADDAGEADSADWKAKSRNFGMTVPAKVLGKQIVTLADAEDYARAGFAVMVDPLDEAVLARWNQLHRSTETPRRKWY